MNNNNYRKGIILAGGLGTRLYPLSLSVSKQLMPIYDKPMIYYPISTLMTAGIKDILIITRPEEKENFYQLFGDGEMLGINLRYEIQKSPDGIAQAFIIGEKFLSQDKCALILGDNIFYGANLDKLLKHASNQQKGSTIFTYE